MSIVFIGTPQFAVPSLRKLAAEGHRVSAVYTQPDRPAGRGRRLTAPPIKIAAWELGILIHQPETLRDEAVLAELRAIGPEVIVAVAYGQILRKEVLDIPSKGVLNVHPSLLPRWRGASPIATAILAGEDETGVTIMLMDPGMDTGPILSQHAVPISPLDTTATLTETLADAGARLLVDTLPGWLSGAIVPVPQDDSKVTVTRPIKKEDGAIDWQRPARDIWRQVRAFNPWPSAYSWLDAELIRIWEGWPLEGEADPAPGTLVQIPEREETQAVGPAAFAVQTGSGLLAVLRAQRADRRVLDSADFLRGVPDLIGRRLSRHA